MAVGSWIIHSVGLGVALTVLAVASLIAREVRFSRAGPTALSGPLTVVATLASIAVLVIVLARFVVIA